MAFRAKDIGMELQIPIWRLRTWMTFTPRAVERYMHAMFRNEKITGEWFRLSYQEVEQLRRFRLNAPALPPYTPPIPLPQPKPIQTQQFSLSFVLPGRRKRTNRVPYTCYHCQASWMGQPAPLPERCPNCSTRGWNLPIKRPRGRPKGFRPRRGPPDSTP